MDCTKPDSGQGTFRVCRRVYQLAVPAQAIESSIYDISNEYSQCLLNAHVPDTLENSMPILVPHNSVVYFCEGSGMWVEESLNTRFLMINDALRSIWRNGVTGGIRLRDK